jgi:nucleotide-binding universal stress UspA family protein
VSAAVYRRILVGTDGSTTAAIAVDRAVDVAKSTGSKLTIMCVDNLERATAIAQKEAARHEASGVEIDVKTAEGDPASVLVEEAETYGLLVVGNKGMTGASRFFLGSVPNKVSHHVPVALLIVRTT